MILHNNEKDNLHIVCSYFYEEAKCKLVNMDDYPKVMIEFGSNIIKQVDAS